MNIEDQSSTLKFLASGEAQGVPASQVSTIQTHISVVVLAGERAYKLKRAVHLPYVDFSTPERRLQACLRELELNRHTAPMLYLAVRRITRDSQGRLAFDGPGEIVDAVVEMRRFGDDALLDKIAEQGRLTPALATRLARAVAGFHKSAAIVGGVRHGAMLAHVLEMNERAFATSRLLPEAGIAELTGALRAALEKHGALLDKRARDGKVRRCHGDLHLRNICVVDGKPILFDCIEFDESLATIDVLYDLSFLLMDLWQRGLTRHANLVLNRYLDEWDEGGGLPLMPFFIALRAAIRAHILATQAAESQGASHVSLLQGARRYLDMALACLAPAPARLIAIGGLSGSGKSTLAAAIADGIGPLPGARILSSDRIRKGLYGVPAEVSLPAHAYDAEVSERVYGEQARQSLLLLGSGCAVIADAVFDRVTERARIEQCAKQAGVPFTGFWLEAPAATLLARVGQRRDDASDATEAVVRAQLARQRELAGWIPIEAGGAPGATVARVISELAAGPRP